jgi:hypothetical protein
LPVYSQGVMFPVCYWWVVDNWGAVDKSGVER